MSISSTNISIIELRSKFITSLSGTFTFPETNISLNKFRGCELRDTITFTDDYEDTFLSNNTFTVPSGVTQLSAVCVGGGGGAGGSPGTSNYSGAGGGGAGLSYGTFTVTPSETLTIIIGSGGAGGAAGTNNGNAGGNSIIKRNTTDLLLGGGGAGGVYLPSGKAAGGISGGTQRVGGGTGGTGGASQSNNGGGGGGGGGGYSGNGGGGGTGNTGVGSDGSGGGGGGGGGQADGDTQNNGGGGVNVNNGEGVFGSGGLTNGPGIGGSGGSFGGNGGGGGGTYGGGGGGAEDDTSRAGGNGVQGIVRIIWGTQDDQRSYPSTNVAINSVFETYTTIPLVDAISINSVFSEKTFRDMTPEMTITAGISNGGTTDITYTTLTFTSTEPTHVGSVGDFGYGDPPHGITINMGTLSNFTSTDSEANNGHKTFTARLDFDQTGTSPNLHTIDVLAGKYTNSKTSIECENLAALQYSITFGDGLYNFEDWDGTLNRFTFTNCGITGTTGPPLATCRNSYGGSLNDGKWWNDTTNNWLNMTDTGIQRWMVPGNALYTIEVWGARGANTTLRSGGYGVKIKDTFNLTKNSIIGILVGQMGVDSSGIKNTGGGGGTFVINQTTNTNVILIIAGGGGGAPYSTYNSNGGIVGTVNNDGNNGYNSNSGGTAGAGGTNGNGGQCLLLSGGGGGGFLGDGGSSTNNHLPYAGRGG